MDAGNPPADADAWFNGDAVARERLAMPYFTTHDKTLPNARRSQRGTGTCLPAHPVASIVHAPDPAARPAFLTDAGFATASMHRRGRGGASPLPLRPTSNPNEAGVPTGAPAVAPVTGHGMASGSSQIEQQLLGGRRARGLCSPRPERVSNLLAWGDA